MQTIAATDQTKLCIVQPTEATISETFIRAHAERLPARTTVVHGHIPHIGNGPLLSQSLAKRAMRRAYAVASRKDANWEQAVAYEKALRKTRPDVVLAEYGPTGVDVMDICRRQQIPLVVHFHGYDASQHDVLERNRSAYQTMFRQAAAIVAVSKRMQQELLALGADANKLHYNPYGVDCDAFTQAEPGKRPPVFVAVGRFVEKKAPQLTLLAFGRVLHDCPSAQLRMVGDGPLLGACQALARGLNIEQQVSFLGAQGHDRVRQEMQQARCFVQHSLRASNGDSEGTPVAILEAGASGLPVVATRHAGIPDVVQHGHTGLLVDEHDVNAMVEAMLHLAEKPVVAAEMGKAARLRIVECFPMQRSINRLASIIESCVENQAQRSIAQ